MKIETRRLDGCLFGGTLPPQLSAVRFSNLFFALTFFSSAQYAVRFSFVIFDDVGFLEFERRCFLFRDNFSCFFDVWSLVWVINMQSIWNYFCFLNLLLAVLKGGEEYKNYVLKTKFKYRNHLEVGSTYFNDVNVWEMILLKNKFTMSHQFNGWHRW